MAATTFTTWSDLHASMLNALAEFAANRMQVAEYEVNSGSGTRKFKYRTFQELKDGLVFVKQMADLESPSVPARTYAKNGGGGRW